MSFVQRRGRARRADSKYFLFASDDEFAKGNKPWSALEAEMKAMYMDDSRTLQLRPSEKPPRTYGVPSTGALLTMDDAMSHLYHFCSISTKNASSYVDLRPEFESKFSPVKECWTATVDLPASVHPSVRHASSAQEWDNEEEAIQDAALEAYIALHRAGLVNDNLLPLIKDYGPEIGVQHIDQPSIVEVAERLSPLSKICPQGTDPRIWTANIVQLQLREDLVVEVIMWLPGASRVSESFELYWNSHITYHVKTFGDRSLELSQRAKAPTQQCTITLLSAAHAQRMEANRHDFAVMFSSAELEDVSRGTLLHGRTWSAASYFSDHCNLQNIGLAHVASQQGRSYFVDDISKDSSEIICHTFPKRKDFLHPIPAENALSSAHTGKEVLNIKDCTFDIVPARYALLSAFVPSIIHKVETRLLAQNLMDTLLKDVGFKDHALIQEAISSPAAGETTDYNRLEYLGDCVLKHYTELQVMSQHTHWPEAYMSLERDRIVRNTNLATAAVELGLDKYILTKPFTGTKWRPPYISDLLKEQLTTRQMSTKTLADVVEALIGAAYLEGGKEKAFGCIQVLLPQESWHASDDCLQTLVAELTPTKVTNFSKLEALIGHNFVHPTLLAEAITHVSFPDNKTGMSYERLEFLGDSVLDMIITPKLFSHPRKLKHWQLHSVHAALVNSHFLGYCCLRYDVNDEVYDIVETAAGDYAAQSSDRRIHLHDFLRAGHQLNQAKHHAAEAFEKISPQIEHALAKGSVYPWVELITLSPPKFFCDLVESILGAIFIDTLGDLAACEAFVAKLGILEYMQRLLDDGIDCVNPKEMLGIVADQAEVKYLNSKTADDDGRTTYQCVVKVDDEAILTVDGCRSKDEAEIRAAFEACEILKSREPVRRDRKRRKLRNAGLDDPTRAGAEETGAE